MLYHPHLSNDQEMDEMAAKHSLDIQQLSAILWECSTDVVSLLQWPVSGQIHNKVSLNNIHKLQLLSTSVITVGDFCLSASATVQLHHLAPETFPKTILQIVFRKILSRIASCNQLALHLQRYPLHEDAK